MVLHQDSVEVTEQTRRPLTNRLYQGETDGHYDSIAVLALYLRQYAVDTFWQVVQPALQSIMIQK